MRNILPVLVGAFLLVFTMSAGAVKSEKNEWLLLPPERFSMTTGVSISALITVELIPHAEDQRYIFEFRAHKAEIAKKSGMPELALPSDFDGPLYRYIYVFNNRGPQEVEWAISGEDFEHTVNNSPLMAQIIRGFSFTTAPGEIKVVTFVTDSEPVSIEAVFSFAVLDKDARDPGKAWSLVSGSSGRVYVPDSQSAIGMEVSGDDILQELAGG